MKICPECYDEFEKFEVVGSTSGHMLYCPFCGNELQDKATFEANEKANDEDDAIEARKLEDKND